MRTSLPEVSAAGARRDDTPAGGLCGSGAYPNGLGRRFVCAKVSDRSLKNFAIGSP